MTTNHCDSHGGHHKNARDSGSSSKESEVDDSDNEDYVEQFGDKNRGGRGEVLDADDGGACPGKLLNCRGRPNGLPPSETQIRRQYS